MSFERDFDFHGIRNWSLAVAFEFCSFAGFFFVCFLGRSRNTTAHEGNELYMGQTQLVCEMGPNFMRDCSRAPGSLRCNAHLYGICLAGKALIRAESGRVCMTR